jgi:hypothetical protein
MIDVNTNINGLNMMTSVKWLIPAAFLLVSTGPEFVR